MSTYLCETCSRVFPGRCTGSTFLVKPNGMTTHLCSGACLRAHVNGQPVKRAAGLLVIGISVLAGFACGVATSGILNRVTH